MSVSLSGARARQAARAEGNRALAGALLAAHLAAIIASKGAMQAASVPNLCARRAGSGGSGQSRQVRPGPRQSNSGPRAQGTQVPVQGPRCADSSSAGLPSPPPSSPLGSRALQGSDTLDTPTLDTPTRSDTTHASQLSNHPQTPVRHRPDTSDTVDTSVNRHRSDTAHCSDTTPTPPTPPTLRHIRAQLS